MSNLCTDACCVIKIPPMCVGAQASAVTHPAGTALNEAGLITYKYPDAVLAVGRLATRLPGYNPAWTTLSAYSFNSSTMSLEWTATEYRVSGGSVGTPTDVTSGGCATDSYNTGDNAYTLISWWSELDTELNITGWTNGAGGYCTCPNNVSCDCSESSCERGYIPPGGSIATVPANINTIAPSVSVPGAAGAGATGGGGGGGSADCNVFIGVVVEGPTGGFGRGAVTSAVFQPNGSYTTSGSTISVIFPYIS